MEERVIVLKYSTDKPVPDAKVIWHSWLSGDVIVDFCSKNGWNLQVDQDMRVDKIFLT